MHLNIRSLHRNLDSLTTLLKNVDLRFSFIGITETWLRDSSLHTDISGYNFVNNPRKDRTGGGVGLYLADNFDFKCRPDLVFSCTKCAESLFVEINRPKEKNIIVGVVYRSPNQNLQDFMNSLDLLLASISKENKICYVVGDWNLDLINHHCHESTGEFLEIMYSRMFFPVITRPTRITSNTATLIDNIFTNNLNNFFVSGLMFCDISDHLPIFTLLLDQSKNSNETTWLSFRDKSINNVATFTNRLENVNWDELSEYKDPDCAYRCFLDKYTTLYNDCFPLKKVKVKNVTLSNPWITKGLLKSIRKKNSLYKRFLAKPTSYRENLYKSYKNKLTHSLRVAKRLYYNKKLYEYKSNAKSTWKLLNDLINRKKSKCKLPSYFKSNEEEILNPTHIANRFCEYFTNIGPDLDKNQFRLLTNLTVLFWMEALLIHFFFNWQQNKKSGRFVLAFDLVLLQDMIVFQ